LPRRHLRPHPRNGVIRFHRLIDRILKIIQKRAVVHA